MSLEKDQDYFCEGMADEIINAFAGLEGLRVASRTSSFRFKEPGADIRGIGDQLNVATVLERSVRKSGTRLRVTAQLTDVGSGYNLWSRRYDRELEDVFAIQDEIAQSIVGALEIEFSAVEQDALDRAATSDLEAYDFYLRGRKAVELGGDFAEAHTARGLALSLDQQYEAAGRALERALQLNPRLFEAHYFYGRVCREQGRLEGAVDYFERAIAGGYASREWIDKDSDLDPIRTHPRFQEALATLAR